MAIEISWAAAKDAKELESLDRMAHEEDRFWRMQSKSKFVSVIRKSKFLTLIARENGRAIAYLQSGERNTRTHVWVENVFVLGEFRRRSIAKSLMRKFTAHWRGKVDYIVLLTADEKIDIFKRLGFRKEMNYMRYDYGGRRKDKSY
jgi:ribosomal protein S18 acetylase RimI-like enzyme